MIPLVRRVHLPGHVPEGCVQGEHRVSEHHPVFRHELPEPVGGAVVPLRLRAQEETAAQHVGPRRELPVLGGQVHVVGPAAPVQQPVGDVHAKGQMVLRGDVLQRSVGGAAEESIVCLRHPALLLRAQSLHPAVGAALLHGGLHALRHFAEGEGAGDLRPSVLQGEAAPEEQSFLPRSLVPGIAIEHEGIVPGGEGAVGIGPVPGPVPGLPGFQVGGVIPLESPDGLHPFPAPGLRPPQEGVRVPPVGHGLGLIGPAGPQILQLECAAVAVRRRDGEAQVLSLRPCRGVMLRPLHQEDEAAASAARLLRPVPGAGEDVGVHPGVGGEGPVLQFHGDHAPGSEGRELGIFRLAHVKGKTYLPVRIEDRGVQVIPIRILEVVGLAEGDLIRGDVLPLAVPVGPVGGVQQGLRLPGLGNQSEPGQGQDLGRLKGRRGRCGDWSLRRGGGLRRRRGLRRRDSLSAGSRKQKDKDREKQKRFFHFGTPPYGSTLQFHVASMSRGF